MSTQAQPVVSHGATVESEHDAVWRRRLSWMVLIGIGLRIGFILLAHTYRFKAENGTFGFGYEMGRIAASLAEGHGFSSPFYQPTGPTAWQPPLYPLLIAAVFKMAGVYSTASAIILLGINSIFSALTTIPIFHLARRSFGEKIASWSAWTWTLSPWAAYWAVKWVWETSITAFLLCVMLVLACRLGERGRRRGWIGWGFLWGIAALLNTSLLAVLPISWLWIVEHSLERKRKIVASTALAALLCLAVIAPWAIRNFLTFHKPVFLRTNFGVELRIGNGPGANGLAMDYRHPTHNVLEFAKYRKMGEVAYAKECGQQALYWIEQNPAEFAKVTLARIVYYWTSLPWGGRVMPPKNALFLASSVCAFWGLWLMRKQGRPVLGLYAICLVVFPLVYYIVFPHPRYRGAIEPEITILIVYLVSQTSTLKRAHPSSGRFDGTAV
jgi:4-amino-4-deoxy-L-arabinose transferase-like glycosyltransferase